MGDAKEVLGADDIDYITVLDYDTEKKESYWNAAFSDNIKTLIEDSQESVTNMVRMIDMQSRLLKSELKKIILQFIYHLVSVNFIFIFLFYEEVELAGMIMKVTMNGDKRCMMIKILGPSRCKY